MVDDRSTDPVTEWSEWSSIFSNSKSIIKILRQKTQLGFAGAKHAGAEYATRETAIGSKEIIIFLEPNVVVSANWIAPLYNTFADHPKSMVYPAIDVLDMSHSRIIKSSNVLGGFDWGFGFKWEDAQKSDRLVGAGSKPVEEDAAATSPAAPSIFAITSNHYKFVGGLSTILRDSDIETVELSIRTWTCGGSVIRQPCSRVAQRFFNLDHDYVKPLRKLEVDKAALEVAEQWLDGPHVEYVFMSRFTGSMPYKIDIPLDSRGPIQVIKAPKLVDDKCASFNWYLTEIYPGLRSDMQEVSSQYQAFLDSKYEARLLEPLVKQYASTSTRSYNTAEVEKLKAHASIVAEIQISDVHRTREPPKPREKTLQDLVDEAHDMHADKVRQTFLCEDEKIKGASKTCEVRQQNNECQTNKQYMIFGCPVTCGLCGTDNQLCVDFYEKKCKYKRFVVIIP